jgi:hypothetical protein
MFKLFYIMVYFSVTSALRMSGKQEVKPSTPIIPPICSLLDHMNSDVGMSCVNNATGNSFDRIVVVGDVHGSYEGLLEVLYQAGITSNQTYCNWKKQEQNVLFIQMGDIVDRGPGATESWQCLHELQTSVVDNNQVIRLLGNHELYWMKGYVHSRNKTTDTESKMVSLIQRMKEDIVIGNVVASSIINLQHINLLFTHAGIRPHFKKYMSSQGINTVQEISTYMNDALNTSVSKCLSSWCTLDEDVELYEAGKDRLL